MSVKLPKKERLLIVASIVLILGLACWSVFSHHFSKNKSSNDEGKAIKKSGAAIICLTNER